MENLDKIHEIIKDATMILIINNNSKSLLDHVFNLIYNKYSSFKVKCNTRSHLIQKFSTIKEKLIRVEFDIKNIQFSSSTAHSKISEDFKNLKLFLMENKSKILFKSDLSSYNIDIFDTLKYSAYRLIPQYNIFDLVILIDKKDIKIIKLENEFKYFNIFSPYGNEEKYIFDITTLLRSTKLKKIQKRIENEL